MTTTAQQIKWSVDPMHSEVLFKVKHLVISTVTGSFKNFSGAASFDGDKVEDAEITFELDVNSIDTNQAQRDAHLRSADFFEADSFPLITFVSSSFRNIKGDIYQLSGDLTIKGITRPVELDAEYGGMEKDAYGNIKMGFEVTGVINRKEFGLTYNALTETGGLALGENIKITANIQLSREV